MRARLAFSLFAVLSAPVAAQDWGVGASIGLVNDVEDRFRLDDFGNQDANAWVEFRLEEQVLLRAAIGSMDVRGENAGRLAQLVPGAPPSELPELETTIEYVTLSVSYQFWDGDYTSGLFGGIGGYRVNPEPAPALVADFRDPHEKVFGWHLGVDADLRIFSRVSFIGRLTYHRVNSEFGRSILAANAGAVFRF
jgi:hypothetical protein